MNVVTTVIKSRHSVRNFKPDPVNELVIKDALECAAHAPTAMNLQPWLFGVIKNKDMLKKIAETTDHGKFIADAPVVLCSFWGKKRKILSRGLLCSNGKSHPCSPGIWHQFLLGSGGKEAVHPKQYGYCLAFRKNIRWSLSLLQVVRLK